jgi:hypothetical protein
MGSRPVSASSNRQGEPARRAPLEPAPRGRRRARAPPPAPPARDRSAPPAPGAATKEHDGYRLAPGPRLARRGDSEIPAKNHLPLQGRSACRREPGAVKARPAKRADPKEEPACLSLLPRKEQRLGRSRRGVSAAERCGTRRTRRAGDPGPPGLSGATTPGAQPPAPVAGVPHAEHHRARARGLREARRRAVVGQGPRSPAGDYRRGDATGVDQPGAGPPAAQARWRAAVRADRGGGPVPRRPRRRVAAGPGDRPLRREG